MAEGRDSIAINKADILPGQNQNDPSKVQTMQPHLAPTSYRGPWYARVSLLVCASPVSSCSLSASHNLVDKMAY